MANIEKPDFSPLVEGSKEYNQAVNARKEMIGWLAKAAPHNEVKRKTWRERMLQRAVNFK